MKLLTMWFQKNKSAIQKTCEAWLDQAMPEGSMMRYYASVDDTTGEADSKKMEKLCRRYG